jgi:NDP-sugar pyrophosphorylase family protein
MKTMILAAGLGTRLRPLTYERAKPAIPLLGEPLLIRLIRWLAAQGAGAFRINLHHLPHTIESLFSAAPWDTMPVSFSYEPEILGTAGGLKANESFFDDGTLVMVNGDIVADFSITEALRFHRERGALATLLLVRQDPPYQYVPVRIDRENRLRNFKGACPGGDLLPEAYIFTGVHILEPEIFRFIPPDQFYEINDQVYPAAMKSGLPVYGYPVEGYWNDLGQPWRYLDAQRALMERAGRHASAHVSSTSTIAAASRLGPFVSVGTSCQVDAASSLENSILWDRVRVKDQASLKSCIVGSDMTVSGTHEHRIITRYGEVPLAQG